MTSSLRRVASLALLALASAACHDSGSESGQADAGTCVIGEPAAALANGIATHRFHRPTTPDPSGLGSLQMLLVCADPAAIGDQLTFVFPNLNSQLKPGEYRIVPPNTTPERLEGIPRTNYVVSVLQRSTVAPLRYIAHAGTVKILKVDGTIIDGVYQIALLPVDSALQEPVVLGGAFRSEELTHP